MIKNLGILLLLLIGFSTANAQSFQFVDEAQASAASAGDVNLSLRKYRVAQADVASIQQALADAPAEFTEAAKGVLPTIDLPLPNGRTQTFRVIESSVLHPNDQANWPQLRTYRILQAGQPHYNGRMSVTPRGITAVFNTADGEVFIEPYAAQQQQYYVVYYNRDVQLTDAQLPQLSCGYQPSEAELTHQHTARPSSSSSAAKTSAPAIVREYVLALTCTGEYAQLKGGTVETVLASFVEGVNLANATFEREVGVRARLIENAHLLVYLNAGTDPFINADNGGELLSQVRGAITGAGFPTTAYDMGHVFTGGCTDVGGVVSGNTCTGGKDRAVTCHYSGSIQAIIRGVFTHEVAHQFSVAHSWANCPNSLGQLASGSAYEPGSGSTIMSYAGACGNQNIQSNNDDYYHGHSIEQFLDYTREGNADQCATFITTSNTEPKVTLPYQDGFFIPISTPFELVASAVDQEGDALTYCWEQMDLDLMIRDIGDPAGNTPLFRSYSPVAQPNRVFPRMTRIVNNQSNVSEVLPTYSRNLTFRCTVRDNNPEIGATVWEQVAFRSTATAGPFLVLSPNTADEVWRAGEYREVTWDVANTDNDVVNCQTVDIRLSTDGGFTYPITLIEGARNNGSAFVHVPNVSGSNMRIRVEASENVFFDISNANFRIDPATAPSYTVTYGPIFQQLCLPDVTEIAFTAGGILNFSEPVSLAVHNALPTGVVANFAAASLLPGETTTLQLDLTNLNDYDGPLEIVVAAASNDSDTTFRTIYLDVVDNDFSDLQLLTPAEGADAINLSTTFSWSPVANAQTYDWELSDDAAFSNIITSAYGITETSVLPATIQLEGNTLFFWRVRAINECGPGDWQQPSVFHTVNAICSPEASNDTPRTIPGTGPLPTVTSELYVPFDGVISDINIPFLFVRYQPIQNFWISLTSPAGTEVKLYDRNCFSSDVVNVGFDDQAPTGITCPPNGNLLFQPAESLSAFIGENSLGTWTLKVKVLQTGFGSSGQLGDWGIEFCAAGTALAPALVRNDTLFVPPLMDNTITTTLLQVTDTEQSPEELIYTLVSTPGHGQLYVVDRLLTPGSSFTQATINANNLRYLNTNGDAIHDAFTFVVQDGTGGFLPVQRFAIKMDEDAVVGTNSPILEAATFKIFPNPTTADATLAMDIPTEDELPLRVYHLSGQLVLSGVLPKHTSQYALPLGNQPAGIYIVQVGGQVARMVKQ